MDWFYEQNGGQQGPTTTDEMIRLIRSAVLTANTLVWNASLPDWVPAGQSELAPHFETIAAPPPRPVTYPAVPQHGASDVGWGHSNHGGAHDDGSGYGVGYGASPMRTKTRSGVSFVLLSLFTCGIYFLYLVYQWAAEIAEHERKRDSTPVLMLLLAFFTCGLAGPIIAAVYASRINKVMDDRQMPQSERLSVPLVIGLIVGSLIVSIVGQVFASGAERLIDGGNEAAAAMVLLVFGGLSIVGSCASLFGYWQVQVGLNRLSQAT